MLFNNLIISFYYELVYLKEMYLCLHLVKELSLHQEQKKPLAVKSLLANGKAFGKYLVHFRKIRFLELAKYML